MCRGMAVLEPKLAIWHYSVFSAMFGQRIVQDRLKYLTQAGREADRPITGWAIGVFPFLG